MGKQQGEAALMQGVSGMRGLVGQSLTPDIASRYAAALGTWVRNEIAKGQGRPGRDPSVMPHVIVGRDSRSSGPILEMAATSGLLAVGCRVTLLGLSATPTTAVMAHHLQADAAVMITASHNPLPWNGLKPLGYDGGAPLPDEIHALLRILDAGSMSYITRGTFPRVSYDDTGAQVHVDRVLGLLDVDMIRERPLKVVLDSVHGAGGEAAQRLLGALGAELVHLYAEPTGMFPHTPEPTRANLTGLCDAVKAHGADVGFAQDPDADRLAVVDQNGRYIGEDYSYVLPAMNLLERMGDDARGAVLAANLSTSQLVDDVCRSHGATLIRTPVGESNVLRGMKAHGALAGGEGSGGMIWPAVGWTRDSIANMAMVLELIARRRQPIGGIVDQLPTYTMLKDKVPFDPQMADQLAPRMKARFAAQKIDEQDGVRVDFPDKWVHIRPSNTEPIIRIIAESKQPGDAKALVEEVRSLFL